MAFTAKDVAALREKTGCGMMDCKKALTETDGDMEKAIDFLREKGLAAAAKKASRIAAEGTVYTASENGVAVVIEVNAETDFVAKNVDFMEFVDLCAKTVIAENPADVEALLAVKAFGCENTVQEVLTEKIQTIGENIKIRRFVRYEGVTESYVHMGGKIGVLAKFNTSDEIAAKPEFVEFAHNICMQIAALNPLYLNDAAVPAEVIEKEKEIATEQLKNDPKNANKPANIIEKIVAGKIGKYFEEVCLVNQVYVIDSDLKVSQYVANTAKALGGDIAIDSFVRFEKGEGLQKREDDFAAEVAAMAGK